MADKSYLKGGTVLAFAFNMPTRQFYTVIDVRHSQDGDVLLRIINQDCHPKTVSITFKKNQLYRKIDVEIGDKMEITPKRNIRDMYWEYKYFNGLGQHLVIQEFKLWKPNVVSVSGWRKLK